MLFYQLTVMIYFLFKIYQQSVKKLINHTLKIFDFFFILFDEELRNYLHVLEIHQVFKNIIRYVLQSLVPADRFIQISWHKGDFSLVHFHLEGL